MSSSFALHDGETPRAARERGASDRVDVHVAGLGRLLRGIGAAVLLAAASSFLLQHWEAGNDLERYAGLLGLTALLAVAGIATGVRLRESKGARTFLALATAVVPAHFCILGGFLYSRFAWGSGPHPVAGYATWIAPSGPVALGVTVAALAVLAPVSWVSLLALARARARALTAALLALCGLLLVPTREPQAVAALVAGAMLALGTFELRVLRRELALRTFEGLLVRGMLAAPVVLLVARSVLHYELSALLGAVVCAGAALLAFALSREVHLGARWGRALEVASLVPAGGACLFGAAALEAAGLPEPAVIPAIALPFAGVLVAVSAFARAGGGGGYRSAAAFVATGGAMLDLALFGGVLASFVCLAVSITALAWGYAARRRGVTMAGAGGAVWALAHHVAAAIHLFAWASWGSLALLGVAVIVGASLLERHHRAWAASWTSLRRRLARWEY